MNKKFLPYLILFCALGLAATAGYYSIIGLSLLFAGVAIPVMIMGVFLEISKLTIATLLHSYWKELKTLMKTYLTIAVIILSFITSIGIYGLLSSGYQTTANKSGVLDKEIKMIETNIESYNISKSDLKSELKQIQTSSSQLRNALGNNTQSRVDRNGNVITTTSNANRKAYESQLSLLAQNEQVISSKIQILDSLILKESQHKLSLETNSDIAAEIGPLKYISEITGSKMGNIINWLILCIVFVFDPLAISLVVAANFAFEKTKPKTPPHQYEIYSEPTPTPELTPEITPPSQPIHVPQPPTPNSEEENIQKQIQDIQNSNSSHRKKHTAIEHLQGMLSKIKKDEDDVKTY